MASSAQPATGTSADDLLSQLAGSEIDRLLAEADGKSPASPANDAAPGPGDSHEEQAAANQLDQLLNEEQAPAALATPAGEDAAAANESLPEGAERAAVLDAAGFDKPEPVKAEAAVSDAAPAAAERTAVLEAAGFRPHDPPAATAAANQPPAAPAPATVPPPAPTAGEKPFPAYLKPLLWINAPLESRPPIIRKVLGMAAIVMLVNALAALAYVMFCRKT